MNALLQALGIGTIIGLFQVLLMYIDSRFDIDGDPNILGYIINGITILILILLYVK